MGLPDPAVANSLDVVAIRIEHERPVIVGVIMRAQSRRAVVRAAGRERGLVKPVDGFPVRRGEGDMGASLQNALMADPEEGFFVGAIAGGAVAFTAPDRE